MPDIRLVQNVNFPAVSVSIDWALLLSGGLDQSQALASAVVLALGTDRLADVSDELPQPDSTDRRGWWGDFDADVVWGAWPIGSRIWLLSRTKITDSAYWRGATVTRVEDYVRESLQPFVDNLIVSSFDLEVEIDSRNFQRINVGVTMWRNLQVVVALQFQVLWNEITGRPSF